MRRGEPPDAGSERRAVRAWLADNPRPSGRQLAEVGYVAPHWPAPWGRDAGPAAQLAIDEELRRAGVRRPVNPIGIGWAGPTLVHAGTPAQRQRWLGPLLSGEEFWCQLFSEPGAGSDLAALATTAVADGDEWVVSGQKVWTTFAHMAAFGILLARTGRPESGHRGISYFVCPMGLPGVEVRPLIDMTGAHAFNEVFLNEVRIPDGHLVGQVGDGWDLARVTLGNERVSLSGEGALWGQGPTADDLVARVRGSGRGGEPVLRQRTAAAWAEGRVLAALRERTVSATLAGRAPGAGASVRKAIADAHGQRVMGLDRDVAGARATARPAGDGDGGWPGGFLFSAALTIGGGTSEVQRNIIAERVLGLPREGGAS